MPGRYSRMYHRAFMFINKSIHALGAKMELEAKIIIDVFPLFVLVTADGLYPPDDRTKRLIELIDEALLKLHSETENAEKTE
jgi:hypothetical protein